LRPSSLVILLFGCCFLWQQLNISSLAASSSENLLSPHIHQKKATITRADLLKLEDTIEQDLAGTSNGRTASTTFAAKITKLATAGWYANDRRPILEKFETDTSWLKDASPQDAFVAELSLARLEAAQGNVSAARKFIDMVDKNPAPSFKKDEELALYTILDLTSVIVSAQEGHPSDKLLDDAATLLDKRFTDFRVQADFLHAAAVHCHKKAMETLSAAFARSSVRCWRVIMNTPLNGVDLKDYDVADDAQAKPNFYLNRLYFPGVAGEPYIRTLRLLARNDFKTAQFDLEAQDWLECKKFTESFANDDNNSVSECEENYQHSLKLAAETKQTSASVSRSVNASPGASATNTTAIPADVDSTDLEILNKAAMSSLRQEDFEAAEKITKRAMELVESARGNGAPCARQQAQINLFSAYWGTGRFEDARKVAKTLEEQLLAGRIDSDNDVEVLLCCAKIRRVYNENSRSYNLLKEAIDRLEKHICASRIPMSILLWQAAVVVQQSEELPKGCRYTFTSNALMHEAGVLFDPLDPNVGDKQKARFYADLAKRESAGEFNESGWTKAVTWSQKAFGQDDCHTINCKRLLSDENYNHQEPGTMRGGRASLLLDCTDIDEPRALKDDSEPSGEPK
jgi:hypothetical protein